MVVRYKVLIQMATIGGTHQPTLARCLNLAALTSLLILQTTSKRSQFTVPHHLATRLPGIASAGSMSGDSIGVTYISPNGTPLLVRLHGDVRQYLILLFEPRETRIEIFRKFAYYSS